MRGPHDARHRAPAVDDRARRPHRRARATGASSSRARTRSCSRATASMRGCTGSSSARRPPQRERAGLPQARMHRSAQRGGIHERIGTLSIAHTEASIGWGGQEIRMLTEAAGFIARGHRVVVLRGATARASRGGAALRRAGSRAADRRKASARRARDDPHAGTTSASTSSTRTAPPTAWLAAIACRWLDLRRRPRPALVRTRHVSVPVPNDCDDALALSHARRDGSSPPAMRCASS